MTTFAELQQDVYTLTNRPDLVNETARAIRKATIKFHAADKWLRDQNTVVVPLTPLNPGDSRYSIPTNSAPFIRFRDVHMVRQYVNPPNGMFVELKKLEIDNLLDDYGREEYNYYYRSGTSLTLRTYGSWQEAEIVYYQFPDTSPDTYSSWIADLYRDFIVEEASAGIFKMIGQDANFQQFEKYFVENLALLRQAEIV